MNHNWYQKSFRRNLIDMHIPDWNEAFLSEFDPEVYADMLSTAGADTAYIYSSSCLGICYWPTKAGYMHAGLKGRDIFGETVAECRKRGMNVVAYFNIWSKWAYDNHPEWRFINGKGQGTLEYLWTPGHYGVCCPNTPFRDYVKMQIEDLCRNYDFDGMFIDMILWPNNACYCSGCRKRYLQETGKEIPRTVDWGNPEWVQYQRKREKWLAEFASMITETAKKEKPGVSVCHQTAAWSWGWKSGYSEDFFAQSDYLAGDFYGDALSESVVCKLLNNLTREKPFEFMTSRCPNLEHHTTMKTKELLKAEIYSAITNNGSFLFIDAIDPVGTLDRNVYTTMGEIFNETKRYEKYLDVPGDLCQDAAIYLNFESLINLKDNGGTEAEATAAIPLYHAMMNTAKSLIGAHIPYGVITRKNLDTLQNHQVIIVPDLAMMDETEVQAFRQYVENGGSVYFSKGSSLLTKDGVKKDNFMLADVLGVTFLGETKEEITYAAPTEAGQQFFGGFSEKYPLSILSSQIKVRANEGTQVLATTALPYTDPKDPTRFASAISNPPGYGTSGPAIVLNRYGKGRALYAAGNLEAVEEAPHRQVFVNLIKALAAEAFSFEADAPKSVEVTLLHQKNHNRYLVMLLNYQKELPNIPVDNIKIRVRLDGKKPGRLLSLPEEREIMFRMDHDHLEFVAKRLDTFSCYAVDYSES